LNLFKVKELVRMESVLSRRWIWYSVAVLLVTWYSTNYGERLKLRFFLMN